LSRYLTSILGALAILAVGLVPWTWFSRLNVRVHPELPWAALATVVVLVLMTLWLSGREHMRLWPRAARDERAPPAVATIALLVAIYAIWIFVSRLSPSPDLGESPTTAHRWSLFLLGAITAGVVEELAFRGWLQGRLERFDRANALWITSLVFVAAHITQGWQAVLLLGPGLFVVSMLYGMLARRLGTILPGMGLHVLGDLAHVYFGPLRGDGSLLFVN
jgi:uncharacterized protein